MSDLLSPEELEMLLYSEQKKAGDSRSNMEMILGFPLQVKVHLGRTTKSHAELKRVSPGTVLELDRHVNEAVDILVNGRLIGRGFVVVTNERFGIRITEILKLPDRIRELGS